MLVCRKMKRLLATGDFRCIKVNDALLSVVDSSREGRSKVL